jgi:hypothetical protein
MLNAAPQKLWIKTMALPSVRGHGGWNPPPRNKRNGPGPRGPDPFDRYGCSMRAYAMRAASAARWAISSLGSASPTEAKNSS